MKFKSSLRLLLALLVFLAPLPTYALGGSEQLWLNIFSVIVIGVFLVLALLPWFTYRAIKDGRKFWIIITIIFCLTGIFFLFILGWGLFTGGVLKFQLILALLISCGPYIIILDKTSGKISRLKEGLLSGIESVKPEVEYDAPINNYIHVATFTTYQKLTNENETSQLISLLKINNIEYQLEDHSPTADIIFSNSEHEKEFWVKLKNEDFEAADKIQEDFYNSLVDTIDPEHYLFNFTNKELFEVINNQSEWSKLDFLLAQKILKDRGVENSQ